MLKGFAVVDVVVPKSVIVYLRFGALTFASMPSPETTAWAPARPPHAHHAEATGGAAAAAAPRATPPGHPGAAAALGTGHHHHHVAPAASHHGGTPAGNRQAPAPRWALAVLWSVCTLPFTFFCRFSVGVSIY